MDVIKSIKTFLFSDNENKHQTINNKNNEIRSNKDFTNEYYKIIFKLNYNNKKKLNKDEYGDNKIFINFLKQKEEKQSGLKIKVNKCNYNSQINIKSFIKDNKNEKIFKKTKFSTINKTKLNLNENYISSNISFFYILKGAVIIIEDWWKEILIRKRNNKIILKRNIKIKIMNYFHKNIFLNQKIIHEIIIIL